MIDIATIALLVLLVIRGWMRGLVREAIDVGALLVGAVLAFRLAPLAGTILSGFTGMNPDLARIIGGAVLFIGISVGAAILGSLIHRSIKLLPGLTTLNRAGGAALGAAYTGVLVVFAVTLFSAAPVPDAMSVEMERSEVVAFVSEADGPAQRVVGLISGDRSLQSMIWIRSVADGWTIDPGITDITLPVGNEAGGIRASTAASQELFESVNRHRSSADLEQLSWSDELGIVAAARALDAYRTGLLVTSSSIEDRLTSAKIPFGRADERVILASTSDGLADAANTQGMFTGVGIGVVDGPYGLVAVIVLRG